jgi:hypothetical protein
MVAGKMIKTDVEESDEAVFNGLWVKTMKIQFGVVIPLKILYFEFF